MHTPLKKLLDKDFKDAEFTRQFKFIKAPAGHTFEDIMQPAYWGNVSAMMTPWTRIDVAANDGTWYAELLVTTVGRQWARVHLLRKTTLSSADVDQTQAHTHDIRHVEGKGWCVIRRADKVEVMAGEETREAAEVWLVEHLRQTTIPA